MLNRQRTTYAAAPPRNGACTCATNRHSTAGLSITCYGARQSGSVVRVSGQGAYRLLENSLGPDALIGAEGTLRGYVAVSVLEPIVGDRYRFKGQGELRVRAEADVQSPVIATLPTGTAMTLSGDGAFRKLERIDQYVHFDSLQGARAPLFHDRIVVPGGPVAIKAGDLIGHIGPYQKYQADESERKLHLEVISDDDVTVFIEACREWAQRLPDEHKTWLKLVKGTPVVTHQDRYAATHPPSLHADHHLSGSDLLIPKRVLDDLPAERKIALPAAGGQKACHWYRLDGLLSDADDNVIEGWVREEVGVTPWVSPWSWEGFDIVFNYDSLRQTLASFFRSINRFSETELARFDRLADIGDKGPIKNRLFDIIDRNRDGVMSADEVQATTRVPAHALSLSRLIIHCESEWFYKASKWDSLDEIHGHSGSTPHVNWFAEKMRIKQSGWWNEIAEQVGLPGHGWVFHLSPLGLIGNFTATHDDNDLKWLKVPYGQLTFDVEGNDIEDESHPLYRYFSRVVHWPGGASGITIGRGYDLGQRPVPENDLRAVGIQQPLFSWLVGAIGLKGVAARNYLAEAPEDIRKQKITRKQQYELFLPVYEYMKKEVLRISSRRLNKEAYGPLNWEVVDGKIQDILIDLACRGDYSSHTRPFIQRPFVANNPGEIKKIISNREKWASVPEERFKIRAEYL